MDFRKTKWPMAAAGVALLLVVVWLLSNGRRPAPAPNMTDQTSVPHMPSAADVAGLDAVVDGSEPLSPFADRFKVPQDYINEICAYFSNRNIEPWTPSDKLSVQWNKYGELYFVLKDGSRIDVSFYVVGKGGTGFSIGDDFYQADCANDDDGALSIWHVLERASEQFAHQRRSFGLHGPRTSSAWWARSTGMISACRWQANLRSRNNFTTKSVPVWQVRCRAGDWKLRKDRICTQSASWDSYARMRAAYPFGIRIYSTGEGSGRGL